jgi:MSP (Major sperm protein) domain
MSKFAPTGATPTGAQQDWTKFVTLNPPQAVIFRENKEEGKWTSSIDIINKSGEAHILFKVKTTEPNNYIVRPNQGVIKPESSINVKIIC